MAVFEWCPFENSSDTPKISNHVRGFNCRATNIVAYHINKHDISRDLQFDGEFQPLKNNYGIYFLIGDKNEKNSKPVIYIGQASEREETRGMDRLREHLESKTEWYRDKWESAIYVTSTDNKWSTAVIDTLEYLFIECFKAIQDYECLNGKKGKFGNIPDKDFKTELIAIAELLELSRFGYIINKDTKSTVINSVHDKLIEMAYKLKDELHEELKAEYLAKYVPEDRKRIEWVRQAEAYNNFKSNIELANNYVISGRILNGSRGEVITPENTVKQMVDLLPADTFHSKAKFLEPACKSGMFIKCLIDRFMSDDPDLPINHEKEYEDKYKRLRNLIENQIYGICLSYNGYSVSNHRIIETVEHYEEELTRGKFTKSILDSITILPNIIFIDGYESMVKRDPLGLVKILKNKFGLEDDGTLKFDVVIGNPPYNRGMDLDFVNMGYHLSTKYCCMITPAKWQTAEANQQIASRMSYGEFRQKIVPHMRNVVFYPCCKDVFDIYQTDGISYSLIDKNRHEKCIVENRCKDIECFNTVEERSILHEESLLNIGNEIINSINNGTYRKWKFPIITGTKQYQVWINTKVSGYDWYATKTPRYVLSISRILDIKSGEYYEGESKPIFESDSKFECESFVSWLNTRFTRFFLIPNISKLNNIQTDHCFRFVPAPQIDSNGNYRFDHIYTDDELYKAFNLPQKYIDIIEAVVKERK